MESFLIALRAVWPFLCYMFVGLLLKRAKKADEAFFQKLNQVAFVTFFPLNIFKSVYNMPTESMLSGKFLLIVAVVELVVLGALLYTVPKMIQDRKKIPVVIQAMFRSNLQFFALPLAASVFGEDASNQAAMIVALVVPFYNAVCVLILSYYAGEGKTDIKKLIYRVVTNPIILGVLAAFALRLLPFRIPTSVLAPINTLGTAATPISIIVLGGTLKLESVKAAGKYLSVGLSVRYICIPIVLLVLSFVLGLTGFERFLLLMLFITPVAPSSFPMAVNMGADGELAGEYVAVSTVASLFVVFVWIFTLNQFGWL